MYSVKHIIKLANPRSFHKTHGIYYFNLKTKASQWDHPLDGEFKQIVEKTRKRLAAQAQADDESSQVDSGIRSLQGESQANMDNELPKTRLAPLDRRLAPLHSPLGSFSPQTTSFDQIDLNIRQPETQIGPTARQAQLQQQPIQGFTLSGTGSMFLKSNSRKSTSEAPTQDDRIAIAGDSSASASLSVKGILRDSSLTEVKGKTTATDYRMSETESEDRKSVRFNLEKLDTFPPKESSDESSSAESPNEKTNKDHEEEIDWDFPNTNEPPKMQIKPILPLGPTSKPPIPLKSLRTQLSLDDYRRPVPHSLNLLGRTASTDTASDQRSSVSTFFDRKIEKNLMPVKPLYEDTGSESGSASPTPTAPFKIGSVAAARSLFSKQQEVAVVEEHSQRDLHRRQATMRLQQDVDNQRRLAADQEKLQEALQVNEDEFQAKLGEALEVQQIQLAAKMQHHIQLEETKFQQQFEEERQRLDVQHRQKIERLNEQLQLQRDEFQADLESKHNLEVSNFEQKLQRDFEEKQKDISLRHRAAVDLLQKNHSEIFDDLERDLKTEADLLRKEHANNLSQVKMKLEHELEVEKVRMRESGESHQFEKLRCEKRLLEDKYRCLKEKYIRLKTDVKQRLERQSQQRRQPSTTVTTSETERSVSHKLQAEQYTDPRNSLTVTIPAPTADHGKPPASPSASRHHHSSGGRDKSPHREGKALANTTKDKKFGAAAKYISHLTPQNQPDDTTSISQSDTTVSNHHSRVKYLPLQPPLSDNGNSDSEAFRRNQENNNHSRDNRKKLFTRMKSASTSRLNSGNRIDHPPRPCSPMESLRRQLQKLEDLEDQFPDNTLDTTYHLRYPFKDITVAKESTSGPGSSSEMEFFKHRIHMERDSVRRAKDSLRTQRTNFRVRQREIKGRHKTSNRHSLDHLIHEAKELTDMEVSLHRTRALLGEKVIRLRHLEQSLQRVYEKEKPQMVDAAESKHKLLSVVHKEDATVSDLSSHSSSGFSSTDYATETNHLPMAASGNRAGGNESVPESSADIIQSLEFLNSEIREIWEILSKQQRSHGRFIYTNIDLGYFMHFYIIILKVCRLHQR